MKMSCEVSSSSSSLVVWRVCVWRVAVRGSEPCSNRLWLDTKAAMLAHLDHLPLLAVWFASYGAYVAYPTQPTS